MEKNNRKYRFHIIGVYHLPAKKEYLPCAYTQKIVKLIQMLRDLGHEVIYYGAEGSETAATEQVVTHTLQDIRRYFGSGDNRFELGYNWHVGTTFRFDEAEPISDVHKKWIANSIEEMKKRVKSEDFVLSSQGGKSWKAIAEGVGAPLTCEFGIGYHDTFARFKAFESNSLRSFIAGFDYGRKRSNDYLGKMLDRVIPNYFEDADFPDKKYKKGNYLLYVGRAVGLKGFDIAVRVAEDMKIKLIMVGQTKNQVKTKYLEHIGVVNDPVKKAELFGGAIATFVPTQYIEPFGGVNVESQLCGTPVITTDFGVFPETVIDGETGFLCRRYSDFKKAVELAPYLKRDKIRTHAEKYLMSNVKWLYQDWFDTIWDFVQSTKKGIEKGDPKEAWFYI